MNLVAADVSPLHLSIRGSQSRLTSAATVQGSGAKFRFGEFSHRPSDSLAPARSALVGLRLRSDSFHRFPSGSSPPLRGGEGDGHTCFELARSSAKEHELTTFRRFDSTATAHSSRRNPGVAGCRPAASMRPATSPNRRDSNSLALADGLHRPKTGRCHRSPPN